MNRAGLGRATDALVTAGVVTRTRERDYLVLDTPSRRDFWYGHGFELDAPPGAARLDALIAHGRAHFGPLGAARFVVTWERAHDASDPLADAPADTLRDRALVMVYDGKPPAADPRVVDHDDAAWAQAAALAAEEYPAYGSFTAWRFACFRADVGRGRARAVGIRENGRLLTKAVLYRGDGIARFATPVTRPGARGRGLFAACARTLIRWAHADQPREVVIASDPADGPVVLYRRLGFVPVSCVDSVIVRLSPGGPAAAATSPPVE